MADPRKRSYKIAVAFYLLVIVCMIAICIKVFSLKLVAGDDYDKKITENLKEKVKPAIRGNILARDGRTLACSFPQYRIRMDPCADGLTDEVFDAEIGELSRCLADFFKDHDATYYRNKISMARHKRNDRNLALGRPITYTELQKVREFPIFKRGRNRGGFMTEESNTRKMPFGYLAGRTIGTLQGGTGNVGIELTYNKELQGKNGTYCTRRITAAAVDEEIIAPEDGKDVLTTIDIDIQDVAENALMQQLKKYEADHGVAILMEVKTGAVRAIVNLEKTSDGRFLERYNYAIGEASEPGSTFKLATVMAMLEDGKIKDVDNDTINIFQGEFRIHDQVMRDSHVEPNPIVSISKAFQVSSNIAFSRLAMRYYQDDPQRFIDNLKNLGLCDSLGIELKGEGKTNIKNYSKDGKNGWSGTSLPWMSIGYEVQITPLHLLTLYNAVANGGTMMRPMFVEGIMDHGEIVERKRPVVLRNSIASRRTIETVKKMLESVVQVGTAKNISGTKGYAIAGKTGTAQIASKGQYSGKHLASFAGYFPAESPMYSCIVSVSGPNNVYYGNIVAGSVVKAIADRVYSAEFRKGNITQKKQEQIAGVYPYSKGGRIKDIKTVFSKLNLSHNVDVTSAWVSTSAQENSIKISSRHVVDGMMPDVKGMGASDAVSLLESKGLKVQITGFGKVVSQSIPHGERYIKGSTVLLELRNG